MSTKRQQRIVRLGLYLFVLFGLGVSLFHYLGEAAWGHQEVKEVRIGYLRVPNDELLAMEQGRLEEALEKEGFQARFIAFDSGVEANKALASASIDFASMGITNGVVALSRELDVELIWIHELLGTNEALVVQGDRGITKLEDLRGKTIATTFASTSHYSLQKVLEMAGLAKEVTLLDMTTLDIAAAWQRGDIDAAYTWDPILSELVTNKGQILLSSADLVDDGVVTANIMLGRKGFTHAHPQVTSRFLEAIAAAQEDYRTNPEVAANQVATVLEISPETALYQMKGTIWLSAEEQVSEDYMGKPGQVSSFHSLIGEIAQFLHGEKVISRLPSEEDIRTFIQTRYTEAGLQGGGQDD